eukprot:scaffold1690_cov182-Amphora_coffeaeformis.AAC.30
MKEHKKRSKKSKDEVHADEESRQKEETGKHHKKKKAKKDKSVQEENPSHAKNVKADEKQENEDREIPEEDSRMHTEGKGSDSKKKKKHKKDKKRKLDETTEKDASSEAEKSMPEKKDTDTEEPMEEGDDDSAGSAKEGRQKKKSKTESSSSKEKRAQRKAERQRLMDRVPLTDEQGISYTKQQIRRMRKRVARGLPPLETEEEVRERQKAEALLRKQEEAELQGMIYQKDGTVKPEDGDDEEDDEESDEERDEGGNLMDEDDEEEESRKDNEQSQPINTDNDNSPKTAPKPSPQKKTRRNKPVPADYVCQACKNKESPPLHWIYDCPLKVTVPGCNHKSSKNHVNEPSDHKVFVSGLPFDAKSKDVRGLFASCGTIRNVKLMTFEDTKRCKGNAFITFENKEAAVAALKLSGSPLDNSGEEEGKKRKTLTLKVSKLLNRTLTKKKGKNSPLKK